MTRPADRPEFVAPPVVEVILGIRFRRLSGLRQGHFGEFWSRVRDEYPTTTDLPRRVSQAIPVHGAVPLSFEIANAPPTMLSRFHSKDSSKMVQVQDDLLLLNWQKRDDGNSYPRFAALEPHFADIWNHFEQVAESVGELRVFETEVTYVNRLPSSTRSFLAHYGEKAGGAPIDGELVAGQESWTTHVPTLGNSYGYLTTALSFVPAAGVDAASYLLNLSCRSHVHAEDSGNKDVIRELLDQSSAVVVRAFANVTATEWHDKWNRGA